MDIVERLRSRRVDVSEVDIAEAADLIDRLRAEVATYKAAAEAAEANLESALFITQDVRAERDRLRELLSICLQFWLDDSDPDELTEFVTKTKAALGEED